MSLVVRDVTFAGETVSLRATDGVIAELGATVTVEPDDDIIDAARLTLTPGLVNGHTHAAMTLLRGYGDDLPLMEWLRTKIWPAEARLTAEDVYWGTRLAALEMIRSGTVMFWDMYWHSFEAAQAVADAGLRASISMTVIEAADAPEWNRIEGVADGLARLSEYGPRVTPSISAHAIYTVSRASLERIAELGATHDVPLQIHLSETRGEVEDCLRDHGTSPTAYLDEVGFLSDRTVLSHAVWLDDAELDLVASRQTTIVTNPASNMKLATGAAFPYAGARARGIPIGIGTDSAASNNSLDVLQEIKLLALLQKHASADPATLPAAEAWAIATGMASPRLGGHAIAVGAPADFLLVDLATAENRPAGEAAGLVYSATGAVVDTVVVDGRVLMRGRHVPGAEEVIARATECAARLRAEPDHTP
ncbi:MAG TPA: amidohydrolase [Acidimicrobiia bacterium]|nr:amidohydrolase [Acidimicrobiia bacterium]